MAQQIAADDVEFNPKIIAAAWEAFDNGIPAVAAAALVHELPNGITVSANDGDETDRDVVFRDAEVLVEEKAMGVCPRHIAEDHAPAFIDLNRPDGYVLAADAGQVFEEYACPQA